MPRKSLPAPSAPSIEPEKAIPILEGLVHESDSVGRTHRDSPERDEWTHTGEGALKAAFGTNDDIVRAFRLAQCGVYSSNDTEETLNEQAESQFSGMISVLQSAARQLRWRLPDPNQVFLPAGSQHDAFLEIRKIIQQAREELFIVDPWVDHTLWPLLASTFLTIGTASSLSRGRNLKRLRPEPIAHALHSAPTERPAPCWGYMSPEQVRAKELDARTDLFSFGAVLY